MKFLSSLRLKSFSIPTLPVTLFVGFALLLLGLDSAHARVSVQTTSVSSPHQCSIEDFKYRASRFKAKHWTKAKYWGIKQSPIAEKADCFRYNPQLRKRGQSFAHHPASRLLRDQLVPNARRTQPAPLKTSLLNGIPAWTFEFICPVYIASTESVDRPAPARTKFIRVILLREHASPAHQFA